MSSGMWVGGSERWALLPFQGLKGARGKSQRIFGLDLASFVINHDPFCGFYFISLLLGFGHATRQDKSGRRRLICGICGNSG